MKCPRCEIEARDGRCPACGLVLSQASEQSSPDPVSQTPLQFSVSSKAGPPTIAADWRLELRRKLQKYARKKGAPLPGRSAGSAAERRQKAKTAVRKADLDGQASERETGLENGLAKTDEKASPQQERGVERPLFKYRLEDMDKEPRRRIVTFEKTKAQRSPLDKPLIRKPVKATGAAKTAGPEQKSLTLEVVAATTAAPPPTAAPEAGKASSTAEPEVSGEILFSRVLGAIIDVLIAASAGFLFSFIAAQLLGSAFPSSQTLIVAGASGLLFLFFNSVFFLYTLGATPGMASTDLKLVEEDGGAVSLRTALIRTVLSFLVTATVVGLVWAIFDPLRRCWHDRLSQTVVVPGSSGKRQGSTD